MPASKVTVDVLCQDNKVTLDAGDFEAIAKMAVLASNWKLYFVRHGADYDEDQSPKAKGLQKLYNRVISRTEA